MVPLQWYSESLKAVDNYTKRKTMETEIDATIAVWLGWVNDSILGWISPRQGGVAFMDNVPPYSTSDSDAVRLLPILAQRCGDVSLSYHMEIGEWQCWAAGMGQGAWAPTIAMSIVNAVLDVIDSEVEQ